jgi:hypothetical protein
MASGIDNHKFNDDLLLSEADRELARKRYGSIYHVLDHPDLQQLFAEYDAPANRAKRKGLKAGLWAVGLGLARSPPRRSKSRLRILPAYSLRQTVRPKNGSAGCWR